MSDAVSPFVLVLFFLFSFSSATDHIVGQNRGWNPNINYTLWANNHTFYVNDEISFRYQKNMYNVYEVNRTGYDNCTIDGAYGNWSSGKDFITFTEARWYYFICGNYGCQSGMKVAVHVLPVPGPAKATDVGKVKSSGGWRAMAVWRVVLASMAVSVGWIWVGLVGI
ncbi:hypothetical protein AAC387_Pa07g2238 [Persea americana]